MATVSVAFGVAALAYALRGVLVPLFFAFLVAYALDPFVDWLADRRVPRSIAAPIVTITIVGALVTILAYAVPMFVVEVRTAAADLPSQLRGFEDRIEPAVWQTFHVRLPHTMGELGVGFRKNSCRSVQACCPPLPKPSSRTLGYAAVLLSGLIVPVFALYLLIDFDRIVSHAATLVPRRWYPRVARIARRSIERSGATFEGN